MPLTSKGDKIRAAMQKEYGGKKGDSVFYASINKGNVKGAEKAQRLKKAKARKFAGGNTNAT